MSAEDQLAGLLDFIKQARGFDFSGYKRASIERRIQRRMEQIGIGGYPEYTEYLELNPDEFAVLFNTILINVTAFFRDPEAWDALRESTIPELLTAIPPHGPLRVWSAGCSSGEEAYTAAMVLCEVMGEDAYRDRVKIYATDVDEEALNEARSASYQPAAIETVPAASLDRYFERSGQRYVFRKDLRRSIIFGRNDLVQDAPISRIDLLLCRNTLMYFDAETQARILRRLHFALADHGNLVLGRSEMLITHADLFTPVNIKRRVFRKVLRPTLRDRLQFMAGPVAGDSGAVDDHGAPMLLEGAFDASPVAQLLVDHEGRLRHANARARQTFALTPADIGRPVQDLEVSYRPVEIRSLIERVHTERRGATAESVSWTPVQGGEARVYDVQVTPVLDRNDAIGVAITYVDVTAAQRLQGELRDSKHDLEQAYEELQTTVEELETTNEELQSTNEELETTNEELQSTNEELETTNEELESTNEELETMNDELRQRTLELNEVNAFMETVLSSTGLAVAVLDTRQHVRVWNSHAQDLFGLRGDEAEGAHWLALDIGLGVEQLKAPIRSVLGGDDPHAELELDATDRRGRAFSCQVRVLPLVVDGAGPSGAIVLMTRA